LYSYCLFFYHICLVNKDTHSAEIVETNQRRWTKLYRLRLHPWSI